MTRNRTIPVRWPAGLLAVALLALTAVACGDDGGDNAAAPDRSDRTTQAFLEAMTPHHLSAIEMAEMAEDRAEHPETRELASGIVSAQQREVDIMAAIHERLFDSELQPNSASYRDLGLTAEQAGEGGHADVEGLQQADPFDREFIDMMVPHHQAAVRMARAVLEETDDNETRTLATEVIEAQSREIRQMNEWRTAWYGAPSPAGGVPPESEGSTSEGGEETDDPAEGAGMEH